MSRFKKPILIILLFSIMLFASSVFAGRTHNDGHNTRIGLDGVTIDNINIDFDDDVLTVTNTDEKTSFSIDEKYELFINKKHIKTTPEQRNSTKAMYKSIDLIIEEAKDIGWDGAKIGAEGAKLGVHAIMCVFKLLSPNYDSDDLEDEMEERAKLLEKKAEKIELRAEHVEDMARELEVIADKMRDEIPELKKLSWF